MCVCVCHNAVIGETAVTHRCVVLLGFLKLLREWLDLLLQFLLPGLAGRYLLAVIFQTLDHLLEMSYSCLEVQHTHTHTHTQTHSGRVYNGKMQNRGSSDNWYGCKEIIKITKWRPTQRKELKNACYYLSAIHTSSLSPLTRVAIWDYNKSTEPFCTRH